MPRRRAIQLQCSICGQLSEQQIFLSMSMARSPDLDMRPGSPHRETMLHWLQQCPTCNYCAPNISQRLTQQRGKWPWMRCLYEGVYGTASTIVNSAQYQNQITTAAYPSLANRFRCGAMLQKRLGVISHASHLMLCAAWACDDAKATQESHHCRQEATHLLVRAIRIGTTAKPGLAATVLVDILRRTGQFRQARRWCRTGLQHNVSEILQRVLIGQQTLIAQHDQNRYTIAELIGTETYERLVQESYATKTNS